MSDLKAIPALRISGQDLSLHDVFRSLHLRGRLRRILRGPVTERIILDAAKKQGLSVSDEELQKALDAFRTANGLNKADVTQRWLQRNRLTQEDLEARLETDILRGKLMAQVASKEAIEKFFAANRDRFDRARLSRIIVKDEGLANELLTQIKEEGANFHGLLHQHSLDTRGKRLGPSVVPRKRLPPQIEQTVFGTQKGEVVGPFQVGQTYHLLRVEDIRPGQLTPDIAAFIRRMLFQRWLREQIRAARIEVRLPQYL